MAPTLPPLRSRQSFDKSCADPITTLTSGNRRLRCPPRFRVDLDQREFRRIDAVADELAGHRAGSRSELDNVRIGAIAKHRCHRPADEGAGRKKAADLLWILKCLLPEKNGTLRGSRKI